MPTPQFVATRTRPQPSGPSRRGHDPIAEYLDTVRFQPSARNESGELYKEQGRAERAATRDLVDIAGFDRDMMGLLNQFCTGKLPHDKVEDSRGV